MDILTQLYNCDHTCCTTVSKNKRTPLHTAGEFAKHSIIITVVCPSTVFLYTSIPTRDWTYCIVDVLNAQLTKWNFSSLIPITSYPKWQVASIYVTIHCVDKLSYCSCYY